eukprot:m.108533 g.108533  ORF g.108533 m.108533 type:complete len:903 (+) comp10660_c1_seq5:25-2733(+)
MDVLGPNATQRTVSDELGNRIKQQFELFLEEFQESDVAVYVEAAHKMVREETTTIYVNEEHLAEYSSELAQDITRQTYRLMPFLREALRSFVLGLHEEYGTDDKDQPRAFVVSFFNASRQARIRDLTTSMIGSLVSIRGTVVRTSGVHPELLSGTFQCDECKTIIKDVEQQFRYTEPRQCRNTGCGNRTNWKLVLDQSKFVDFQKVRVQESSDEIPSGSMPRSVDIVLRHEAVELAKAGDCSVFTGTLLVVPDVAQLSSAGGRAQMGNKGHNRTEGYSQEGVTGLKTLGVRDLTYKMIFMAGSVAPAEKKAGSINVRDEEATSESVVAELTESQRKELVEMKDDPKVYEKLAQSIAPTIFGHEEIKKGVLLMLLGGVHKGTGDGIKLRGDINVCIVGDPATSKSQFLKYVAQFVPRAVYTSGKASTAAGLTAAVVKDEDSNEFMIEAGAMMLADNGICCIDEFDKMSDVDRVAIHEVMEQQTVTIAKAGIHTSLNARCSVLAAANPVYGRYDEYQTPMDNIGLPDSLLSRFDLLFIMLDEMRPERDRMLAGHVLRSHVFRKTGETDGTPLQIDASADVIIAEDREEDARETPMYAAHDVALFGKRRKNAPKLLNVEFVRKYIMYAKAKCHPVLEMDAAELIAERYAQLRSKETEYKSLPVTARTLECMIRLSTAHAKSRLSDVVERDDAEAALQLINFSYFNNAKPRDKEDDRMAVSDADSSDDDDDDRGDSQGGASSSQRTPAKARRSPTKPASSSKKGSSRTPAKGKGKAADPSDPFAFDDSAPTPRKSTEATTTPRDSTRRAGRRLAATPSTEPASGASAAASAETEPAVEFTEEQYKLVRSTLSKLFSEQREEVVALAVLEAAVAKAGTVSKEELLAILDKMEEDNNIMKSSDKLFKI